MQKLAARGRQLAMLTVFLFGAGTPVLAQTSPILRVNAAEITIAGRVHTQFNTTSIEEEPESELILRRARLEATVRVNDVVSGKVQPEFAGDRVLVRDAYVKFDFDPAVQFLAGRAHRPFSLLEITSSTRMLPIERGLAIRGVSDRDEYEIVHDLGYSDRDVGLQLMGAPTWAPLGLSYAVGTFAGPLAGRLDTGQAYQYAARATVRPIAALAVGAAWSNRPFIALPDSSMIERGNAFAIDAEYGAYAPGFHAVGEFTVGDYDRLDDSNFLAGQAWLAYRTGQLVPKVTNIEPIFRVSYASVDGLADDIGGTLLTPGVNIYFGPLNRMMFNFDYWKAAGGDAENSFKAMFQLAF